MNRDSCSRWVALSDRKACGETLSQAEQRWHLAHVRHCLACAAETHFYSKLDGVLTNPNFLDAHVASLPRSRSIYKFYSACALAVAAVVAVGWFSYARVHSQSFTTTSVSSQSTHSVTRAIEARLTAAIGQVELSAQPTKAGAYVLSIHRLNTRQGQACVTTATGISSCLDAQSEAQWSLEDSRALSVKLSRGRLLSRLITQPSDRPFSIQTTAGRIVAKGTVFSVTVETDGRATVQLHEGRLWLESHTKRTQELAAPSMAVLDGSIVTQPLNESAIERDQALLTLSQRIDTSQTNAGVTLLDVITLPEAAQVTLDGTVIGRTPLSAFVPLGMRLMVELPGYAPIAELLPITKGNSVERRFELLKLPEPSSVTRAVSIDTPKPATPTATELLERAQQSRAQRKYVACANAYRQLFAAYPGSNEARVSLVSLGELELRELGRPQNALRAFEQYLEKRGPLTREARYGKISALEQLGRPGEAKTVALAFLRDYPKSVQAETLRRKYDVP